MGFIDKFKDIVNPKDIDEGYEDDEYVFDDGGNNTEYTNYDTIIVLRQVILRDSSPTAIRRIWEA